MSFQIGDRVQLSFGTSVKVYPTGGGGIVIYNGEPGTVTGQRDSTCAHVTFDIHPGGHVQVSNMYLKPHGTMPLPQRPLVLPRGPAITLEIT